MITKAQLESMFANIAEKTSWDLEGEMLWGYFFKSPTEAALVPAADDLEAKGYSLVGIREDEGQWWLHVEQVEIHSVETLLQRNDEFYALAEAMKIEYDGMDVGPTVLED
jgi:Regulator of ribonuclease activity B